jgi:hypothetical protein
MYSLKKHMSNHGPKCSMSNVRSEIAPCHVPHVSQWGSSENDKSFYITTNTKLYYLLYSFHLGCRCTGYETCYPGMTCGYK